MTAATDLATLDMLAAAVFTDGTEPEWQDRALCAQTDPEAFYPEKGGSNVDAKRICHRCPVENECLEYALVNAERHGIWGGTSERQRHRMRMARQAVTTTTTNATEVAA